MRRKTLDQKATTLSYTDNKRISSARYGAGAVATTTTTTLWQSLSSGENCSNDYILHQRPLTENNENKNGHISQFPPHSFVFCCCQALATPAALLGIGVWSGRVFFSSQHQLESKEYLKRKKWVMPLKSAALMLIFFLFLIGNENLNKEPPNVRRILFRHYWLVVHT